MQKLGNLTVLIGLILSVVGVVVGFWYLFQGDEVAMTWLSLVPYGFMALMLGVTVNQMSKKSK